MNQKFDFQKESFFILLSSSYFDKGSIYMDNLYTSLKLAKDLLDRNTSVRITDRANRGQFSESFNTTKLKQSDSIFIHQYNVMTFHWKDNGGVFVMSFFHGNKMGTMKQYLQNMCGVEKQDQFLVLLIHQKELLKW